MARSAAGHDVHEDESETDRLLRAYHERGDITARERLIEMYLPLVGSLARRNAHAGVDYDDLYQVGCIGLINAIDRFELERRGELAAFAVPNIVGEIRRYVRDRGGSVRLPRRIAELRGPARRAQGELTAQLGRTPTRTELAGALGAAEDDVALALEDGAPTLPLDLAPEAGSSRDAAGAAEERLFLSGAFRGLDERERRILYLRYVLDLEPDDAARELAMSRRQLSRSTQAALAKLRTGLERGAPAQRAPARANAPSTPAAEPQEVPVPSARSGHLLVRIPRSLHAELARAAEREHVSLNRFVRASLARGLGAGADDERSPAAPRLVPAVNAVLLVLALAVAALVLVLALLYGF